LATSSPIGLKGPWSHDEVEGFLAGSVIPLRIAVTTPTEWPLVLSVWFVPVGDELLVATRPTSALVRCLEVRPRCAFEVAGDTPPYCGIRGRAEVVLDHAAGADTLDVLLERYLGGTTSPLADRLRLDAPDEVCIRLRPLSIASWDYRARMASSLDDT
jgi:hypothetical protein